MAVLNHTKHSSKWQKPPLQKQTVHNSQVNSLNLLFTRCVKPQSSLHLVNCPFSFPHNLKTVQLQYDDNYFLQILGDRWLINWNSLRVNYVLTDRFILYSWKMKHESFPFGSSNKKVV